jgi:hypothetical protein
MGNAANSHGGSGTADKLASHCMINGKLYAWLEEMYRREEKARIITMPSNSGVQENQILNILESFERRYGETDRITLHTYDRDFSERETKIKKHRLWRHTKTPDIFREMVFSLDSDVATFVWFDLCGGLSENVRKGTLNTGLYVLNHPCSEVYYTLQVKGCRNLGCASVIERLYKSSGNQLDTNIKITTEAIKALLPYKTKSETLYVYQRRVAYYAVIGFKYESLMG